MNSSLIRSNIIRFIVFVLIQGVVLKGVNIPNIDILLYPLFVLMLPLGMADGLLLLACFAIGMSVDAFYGTMGLHASGALFMGGIRKFVLAFLEPRGGYDAGKALTKANFGVAWFIKYAGILLFLHTFWVSLLEYLQFSWLLGVRIIVVFAISLLLAVVYQFIFNPKE